MDLLEETLVANGYEVCGIARTVDEGVALGEMHKPDLAVLDVRLAKGDRGPRHCPAAQQKRNAGRAVCDG